MTNKDENTIFCAFRWLSAGLYLSSFHPGREHPGLTPGRIQAAPIGTLRIPVAFSISIFLVYLRRIETPCTMPLPPPTRCTLSKYIPQIKIIRPNSIGSTAQ